MEESIIQAFFLPSKRARYISLFGNIKRRKKVRGDLNHFTHLDLKYAKKIDSVADVATLLRAHGAPEICHLMSADIDLDGKDMPLDQAINEIEYRFQGTIVCCIPGKLAYYYGEAGEQRLLLKKVTQV